MNGCKYGGCIDSDKNKHNIAITMKNVFLFFTFLFFIIIPVSGNSNWNTEKDTVYVNNSIFYISASPSIIYKSGFVDFNISTKSYSGDLDIILGNDNIKMKPKESILYNTTSKKLNDTHEKKTYYYVSNIKNITKKSKDKAKNKKEITYKNLTTSEIVTEIISFDDISQDGVNYTINKTIENYEPSWDLLNNFTYLNWNYDNFNNWYVTKNISVIEGEYYNIKIWFDIPVSLNKEKKKYGFGLKPSNMTLEEAKNSNLFFYLDPWYSALYDYRMPVLINNTQNNNDLTNYQVNLTIPYNSNMNPNFSDILIVNDSSGLSLPFWNETIVPSQYAIIYFNASFIPKNSWLNSTYIYYGNKTTVINSSSNGTDTFQKFCCTTNLTGWTITKDVGNIALDYDNRIVINGQSLWGTVGMQSYETLTQPYILEWSDYNTDISGNNGLWCKGLSGSLVCSYTTQGIELTDTGGSIQYGSTGQNELSGSIVVNVTNKFKVIVNSSNKIEYYRNGIRKAGMSSGYDSSTNNKISISSYGTKYNYLWDLRLRKYTSPEPIALLGEEEPKNNSFITNLKTDGVINNTAVFSSSPNFTWDVTPTFGGLITNANVQVWSGASGTGTKYLDYNSNGNISYFVYNGTSLIPNATYYIRVRLNDSLYGARSYIENHFFYGQKPVINSVSVDSTSIIAGASFTLTFNATDAYNTITESAIMITRSQEGTLPNRTLSGGHITKVGNIFTLSVPTSTTSQWYNITLIEINNSVGFSNTTNYTPISVLATGSISTGGGGGGGGYVPAPAATIIAVQSSLFNLSLLNYTGARNLSDIENINECLTESLLLSNKCTGAAIVVLTDSTNWYTMLGTFFASILTMYGLNLISRKKRSYIDSMIYSVMIIIITLVLNLVGFNAVFLFNYLFSNSLSAFTFMTFVLYGIVGTIILDEIVFTKPMIYTMRKINY